MARAFAKIAFTPQVQAAQQRMGSRSAYRSAELGEPEEVVLGPFEEAFISARDSFYLGSVGENGWPYVQHRGGPAGFLRILGPRTLGFADYTGNRQYISVGNLAGDDRVSLFLMDYPNQRRLKVWGRARVVDGDAEPDLLARLDAPHYRARVERAIVISVEAFDWNCPKHITPRFTEAEIRDLHALAPAAPAALTVADDPEIGVGPLSLVVSGVRQLTPRVRAYELHAADGGLLPPVTAGSHLVVPVRMPDGRVVSRQYSLASDPARRDAWEIAVLREEAGRGGSTALHQGWRLSTRLAVDLPVNTFPLGDPALPHVLIAGGIGLTPLKAMAHALKAAGGSFALHVIARSREAIVYREELEREFKATVHLHLTRGPQGRPPDLRALLRDAPTNARFHVCGPARLIQAVQDNARALGLPDGCIQSESFE